MIDKEGYNYDNTSFEVTTIILILALVAIVVFAFIGGAWVISALFAVPMVIGVMIMFTFIFAIMVYFTKFI